MASNDSNGGKVRPRNRRLISTSTELKSGAVSANGAGSSARGLSPIPSQHPSRMKGNGRAMGTQSPKLGGGKGLWEGGWTGSWSALQGLASSVLGGEVEEGEDSWDTSVVQGGDTVRRRTGAAKKVYPSTWGPSGSSNGSLLRKDDIVGQGSLEDRDAAVKAMKMASVLQSHEGVNGGLDVNGRHKRRISGDDLPSGLQDDEGDALVYVHHVQPQDSIAGVVLKYNCQPAVFRKANRLWPNDVIQARKVVFLPVDACAIKGRPCDPPSTDGRPIDFLAPTPSFEEPPNMSTPTDGGPWQSQNGLLLDTSKQEENEWTHVRWVLLSASPSSTPTEIGRLPRKTLGYFPPRRRKSQGTISALSSPRGSFDFQSMPQNPSDLPNSALSTPSRRLSNLGPDRSNIGSYFPAPTSNPTASHLPRRDSSVDASSKASWLSGPGGVGTFERNVRKPGPAPDGLNNWATKNVPFFGLGHLPSSSVLGEGGKGFGFGDSLAEIDEGPLRSYPGSGAVTPGAGGSGLGLEQAAAAIEGWVRRLAVKSPGTPKVGAVGGRNVAEVGDLIELLDGTGSDDGRGFEPAGTNVMAGSGRDDWSSSVRGRPGAKAMKSD